MYDKMREFESQTLIRMRNMQNDYESKLENLAFQISKLESKKSESIKSKPIGDYQDIRNEVGYLK